MKDFSTQELPEAGKPFDISIIEIFVGLFVALIGIPVVGIPVALLCILKFIPILLRGYYYLFYCTPTLLLILADSLQHTHSPSHTDFFDMKFEWICALFIFWVMANVLWPVVAVLGLCLVVIGGFGAGVYAAWAAYKIGFIGGFLWMWEAIKKTDEFTNLFVFDCERSCLGPVDKDILGLTYRSGAFEVV